MTLALTQGRGRIWLRDVLPIMILMLLLVVVAPAMLSDFRLNLLSKFLCYAILAIGIDLIWGYTGMLSLGHAVWFGLGGYAMAMYMKLTASGDALPDFMVWTGLKSLPWFWEPFQYPWFALPVAVIGPGVVAFALGLVVFRSRVKGAYFAILTQAVAATTSLFFIGQQAYTGGTNGLTGFTELFGMRLKDQSTQDTLYYATAGLLLVTLLVGMVLTRSRLGRLMIAIRDDEDRMRFAGYNVAFLKALVYGVSGAMAGLAGALFVPQVGIISPANMGIVPSIEFVLLVAVGGRGTLWGAVVGAITVSWLRSTLSENYPETWQYFYGALFIGAVLLFPTGIVGSLRSLRLEAMHPLRALWPRPPAVEPPAPRDPDLRGVQRAE